MSIVVAHVKVNIPLVKVSIPRSDMERCRMDELNIRGWSYPARGEQLGTDHYFPVGGGGGEGYEKLSSANFLIYAPLQTFCFRNATNFFTHIVFASTFFCLFRL